MAIDYRNWEDVSKAVELLKPMSSFLKDRFFKNEMTVASNTVAWEKITTGDGLAHFVQKDGVARSIAKQTQAAKWLSLLRTKEKFNFSVKEFEDMKLLGSASEKDKISAFDAYILRHMQILKDRVARREEQMCAMALGTGFIEVVESDMLQEVDFDFVNTTNLITQTGTDLWTNAASDPIAQIIGWKRTIAKRTGMNANVVILGESAAAALRANTKYLAQLNNLNTQVGMIKLMGTADLISGAQLITKIENVEFYEYSQVYTGYDGTTVSNMIAADRCILLSDAATQAGHFEYVRGSIYRFDSKSSDFKLQSATSTRADVLKSEDGSSGKFQLETIGLPVIKCPDTIISAKVV